MRLSLAAGLLACTSVQAFSDSSPFILLSTSEFDTPATNDQLQTSAQVLASARDLLGSCPTSGYLIVSQPMASADDIRTTAGGCALPQLCRALASDKIAGRLAVAEVLGEMANHNLTKYILASCTAQGRPVRDLEEIGLPGLPIDASERAKVLAQNDESLGVLLEKADADGDYTFIYLSGQSEAQAPSHHATYEAEFQEPLHMELKRHSGHVTVGRRASSTVPANAGLFEKYQFFTPGIFMGFLALFVMLSILYVGISAISSLHVSYGAFDKENGPAAQKK